MKRNEWKEKQRKIGGALVPIGVTNQDQRSTFVPGPWPGMKCSPLLSRLGSPSWETGTKAGSQLGQHAYSVVVPGVGVGHKAGFSKPKSGFDFRNNYYLFLKRYICIHIYNMFWIKIQFKYETNWKDRGPRKGGWIGTFSNFYQVLNLN